MRSGALGNIAAHYTGCAEHGLAIVSIERSQARQYFQRGGPRQNRIEHLAHTCGCCHCLFYRRSETVAGGVAQVTSESEGKGNTGTAPRTLVVLPVSVLQT